MWNKLRIYTVILVLGAVFFIMGTAYYLGGSQKRRLVISTTTSLFDTGVLKAIEDQFESDHPIDLDFVYAGTGLAIIHGERGDADMILVHAPSKELAFLEEGYGTCRKIVAYNFFAIVGPEEDPVNIKNSSPTQALTKILEAGRSQRAEWVSRGDDSGTHIKEKELWTAAGFDWASIREEQQWYVEAGAGMGKTLQVADSFEAYTLADIGTYLKYYKDGIIVLHALVTQGEELINVYSAIAGNVTRHPSINSEDTITFMRFLTSEQGQEIIGSFGKNVYDTSLFYPAVNLLKHNTDPTVAQWIKDCAFFEGYECPPQYCSDHPGLYN